MASEIVYFLMNHIQNHGAMDLGQFLTTALSHPEYGYYINRDPFGVDGDFTTAPEISQMFGEVVGAWVIDIWMQMGKPKSFSLIECGPGRGTLMADIMRVGHAVEGFADAVQIRLIETSVVLRDKQAKALNAYRVSWCGAVSEINVDEPCIILGNEFLDALPIEQLRRDDRGWQKRVITVDNESDGFKFAWSDADDNLKKLLPTKTESKQIYEIAPTRNQFISECCALLKSSGGVALFIDYGYTKSHYGDTLQAMKKHAFVDVLEDIGNCDITSHIDFEALGHFIREEGLCVGTIATQRNFLMALGIGHRMKALDSNASKTHSDNDYVYIKQDLHQSIKRLIGPDQMGDLFKVMCFYPESTMKPAGF